MISKRSTGIDYYIHLKESPVSVGKQMTLSDEFCEVIASKSAGNCIQAYTEWNGRQRGYENSLEL